jgi:nucleoside-diphosphate-sugar epimerase
VGGHVVEYLFRQNEISKATFRAGSHLKILDLNGVQCMEADLLDHHSLHEAFEGVDTVYGMASPMPGEDGDFERVNAEGTSNLLEVAKESGVKTIVYLSTLDVFGFGAGLVDSQTPAGPSDPYQSSKVSAEKVLLDYARKNPAPRVVVIRAARAVGPRDSTLSAPLLRMISGHRVVLPRSSEMSFTHPKDIAQAMYKAATNEALPGGVFMVKSFDSSPGALAEGLAKAVGIPAAVARAGVFSRAELPKYTIKQLEASTRLAPQAGWKTLGYSPEYDLEKTCEDIAVWHRKEPWVTEET